MTQHDQISAYIDGELSPEQEQDFLISLASSDGLRKSFRSELVLKNVIHRDEILTTPSRSMRGAILATLGIGATALASESAEAAASTVPAAKATLLKTFFASKMSALVTASVVTASALGGYGIHSIISEKAAQPVITAPMENNKPAEIQAAPQMTNSPVTNQQQSHTSAPKKTSLLHKNQVKVKEPVKTEPANTISGSAPAGVKPPVIEKNPK